MNRRKFMQTTTSAVAGGALYLARGQASAQSPGELRVMVYGGDVGKANIEAYVKPFQAETGVKVTPITDQVNVAQLELMVKSNNITVDVVAASANVIFSAAKKGYLQDIDYSIYNKAELEGILDFAKQPFGVTGLLYSFVMFYNREKFPNSKPRPANWAEFWDVKKFPSVRTLITGQNGTEGAWEEALLADGVAPDAIYPMDLDRVFASLDKIKPHIRKWYATGSEIQQIMREKAADIGNCYDGRGQAAIDQGAPIEINRNQAKLSWDYWTIPKGSPNERNAQKFIEFATRAERQAAFAQLAAFGPSNINAYKFIPEERARKLASQPDHLKNSIRMNPKWYTEVGSDGRTNADRLRDRWNDWILR
ncbi:ABC transporter substrate-binding protein [Bradyrhizobium sp. 195]|uniref:ABC transporter substrate-binding protein n=1 Tax=Bradyrhizobium sp. 195 TaxID=2782662 RepID=UPI002001A1F5|nr:ABC transporter substrate-binding protein [Bradyrhizobium sp. 195]